MVSSGSTRRLTLPALNEYRFELDPLERLQITLISGHAELFGLELAPGQPYPFNNEVKAAIWSPTGAELEIAHITGHTTNDYIANESPLPAYLNFHLALSALRLHARPSTYSTHPSNLSLPDDEILGPRVMVVGERGSGKTTLIKTLVNWRVREMKAKGEKTGVLFVNLDVAEGGMTMPGTMSITSMNSLLPTTTPVCSLGTTISSGPPVLANSTTSSTEDGINDWQPSPAIDALAPPVNSLIYWHGHTSPNLNPSLYDLLLKRVGKSVKRKLQEGGLEGWKAGVIVDTPGEWADKKGMGAVSKVVRELEINILLVVGSQKLYVEMSRLMAQNQTVRVVRVPKSDGASEPDISYQSRTKDQQIRSYFYGGPALTQGILSPFSIIVKFDDLKIFRVGEAADSQAPTSALPIGVSRTVSDTELLAVDLTDPKTASQLLNRILALSQAEDDAGDDAIVGSPILGFVYISAIDAVKKKVTILSPLPGRLPRRTLLLASLDFQDS